MPDPLARLVSLLADPVVFTRLAAGVRLRPYQVQPIPRILQSIRDHKGDTLIIVFPRQSGKDELLLQLQAYLLLLYQAAPVSLVVVNPTYQPQTAKAIRRFDDLLERNYLTRNRWRKSGPFVRFIRNARISFLSGDSKSNVLGDTASLLLIINEAQDIKPNDYDRKFAPMTASTNATRLLAGTVWSSNSLLSREIRLARQAERSDGRQRVFMCDAGLVSRCVPLYAQHLQQVLLNHGRQHPLVKSQYFNEEIDAQSSLFSPARLALIRTASPPFQYPPASQPTGVAAGQTSGDRPDPPERVAFLLDVAGQDESAFSTASCLLDQDISLSNTARDSVALSIVEIDLSTLDVLRAPTYRILYRCAWTGLNHLAVLGKIVSLSEFWRPCDIVMDATGVGEGLWALLDRRFPNRVTPVKYNATVKSEIGYRFISIIETGRLRDCAPDPRVEAQYLACQAEILPGPAKTLRWGVPEGRRDSAGGLIHDDHLMADSLVAILDQREWYVSFQSFIIQSEIEKEIGTSF